MLRVCTATGQVCLLDLSELIDDESPTNADDRFDRLCKIVDLMLETLPDKDRKRCLGTLHPDHPDNQ